MPDEYPDYPSHRQLQAYFESYARIFGGYERIRFKHVVQKIMRLPAGEWRVGYQDAEGADHVEQFDVLMIANGHHWDPKYPDYPGTFNGKFIHSHDFKKVDDSWRGKNVLVIGGGNSACDVAVEGARGGVSTGYKESVYKVFLGCLQGPTHPLGLPESSPPPLSHHPTLNSDLL